MGNKDYQKASQHALVAALLAVACLPCTLQATCNNPNNWLEPPGADTKVFIGYKQEQPYSFDSQQIDPEKRYDNAPTPLPADMLDKSGTGTLLTGTDVISYYEPDGHGQWRVCRIDDWAPRSPEESELSSQRYIANSPVLMALNQQEGYVPWGSKRYFYDANGRLQRTEVGRFENPGQPLDIITCRRYDHKGRLTDLFKPEVSQVCPQGEPDVRDIWQRVRYDSRTYGTYYDKLMVLNEWHHGTNDDVVKGRQEEGHWVKSIDFNFALGGRNFFGSAKADYINGVTQISASNVGKLDDNAANTVLNDFGRRTVSDYDFMEQPIPLAVITNPELIYKYHRRRMRWLDGGGAVKLYEGFKPGEHIPHHRMYFTADYFDRHEQLNAQGKVTRVITMEGWKQRYPGPHPDVDDKLLSRSDWFMNPLLWLHKIYHRVYELDENGKPTLVALSWNKRIFVRSWEKHFNMAKWVAYGTPDGKERWKNLDEFEKTFDTSLIGPMLFPDEQKGYKKPRVEHPEPIGTLGLD